MLLRVLILVLALGSAGGAAWLTTSMDQTAPQTTAQPQEIPRQTVLVAATAIAGGEVLSATKLRWQPMPETAVREEFILRDAQPNAVTELSGSFVNTAFAPGEPIQSERLMETNINLLSNKISPGMRAVAVKITAENTAGGFILPGDRVDVIHTITRPGPSGQPARHDSEIVISNVRVMAVDQTALQAPEGTVLGKTATLELSPDEAERIVSAEASGTLSLVLRAISDHADTVQEVLVTGTALEPGDRIDSDNLRWEQISNPQTNAAYVRRDESPDAMTALAGAFTDRAFVAGEPLRANRLHKTNRNLMSNRLTVGKRATAVKVSAEATAGGFILPGDRVDVIRTTRMPAERDGPPRYRTDVIVLNALVLAIDQSAETVPAPAVAPSADGASELTIVGATATLELSPEEAERVLEGGTESTLALSLRANGDQDGAVDVLVAVDRIDPGTALGKTAMRWRPVLTGSLRDSHIRRDQAPDALDKMIGYFADRTFLPGEPLRLDRLTLNNPNQMSYRVVPGMRAAGVKVTAETVAGAFVLPGNRVDVVHTFQVAEVDGEPPKTESRTIARNVRVLAVGQVSAQAGRDAAVEQTVTLELSSPQTERVMTAQESGKIALALRAATDQDPGKTVEAAPARTVRIHRADRTETVTLR